MRPFAELVLPALRFDPERGFEHERATIDRGLDLGVGGFIVFGGERGAVRRLTHDLQAAAPHRLLIASDLERGAGQQVRGLTPLPPVMALARLGEDAVREAARLTALEARDVGINWALAPVVDLDVEPANPIVATRAFGAEPARVASLAAAWIEACQKEGVLACAKHFPGHGRTRTDSHAELPIVGAHWSDLLDDLEPFARAIASGVRTIMTAHVAYPALDASGSPATYSRPVLFNLLRMGMRFRGLVVTDALIMEGAQRGIGEAEGAVAALEAGCDLLLYPKGLEAVAHAVEEAVAEGGALAGMAPEAAAKRRDAATWAGGPAFLTEAELAGHRERGEALCRRAVTLLRGEPPKPRGAVSVEIVDDDAGGPYPLPTRTTFADTLRAEGVEMRDDGERVVLLFSDVKSWKGHVELSASSRERLAAALARPATVVLFGHPRELEEIPGSGAVLCAWSGDEGMQRAAAQRLAGRA